MSQITPLITTLKQCLKAEGKTYADVAQAIGVSESTVKRMFSDKHLSLSRLEEICRTIGLNLSDLFQKMQASQHMLERLSHQQEEEITQDLMLLLITICILNHWTPEEITRAYHISDSECLKKLIILDRLEIIDLLPSNQVKLRISPNFSWQAGGPIQRFFQEKVGHEFFNSTFSGDDECLFVLNGMLSRQSNGEFQRKLKRLINEFNELNKDDTSLSFEERNGVTLVLAMRNWQYGLFEKMRK